MRVRNEANKAVSSQVIYNDIINTCYGHLNLKLILEQKAEDYILRPFSLPLFLAKAWTATQWTFKYDSLRDF